MPRSSGTEAADPVATEFQRSKRTARVVEGRRAILARPTGTSSTVP